MKIKILDKQKCVDCVVHTCSFLNTSVSKKDFYNLPSETTICPNQAIEAGPSNKDMDDGFIVATNCINCGLCVKYCHNRNLSIVDFDENTDIFRNLTEPQLNAVTSLYLSTLFGFAANTNRNRALQFDGYISTKDGEECFVEIDWNDDSLECTRRLLGDILIYSANRSLKNGLIVLSHLPILGSRDVFTVLDKIKSFPTTKDIKIYFTTFGILKRLSLNLDSNDFKLEDLFYDVMLESQEEYNAKVNNLLNQRHLIP